ncbi:MAG: rhodanese-like domain-containing protein [Holophagaceae bacterium]|nr:rhodanese-like domain-containing protein [Holophagaceae bacterium]
MIRFLWLLLLLLPAWWLLRRRAAPDSLAGLDSLANRNPQRVDVRTHAEFTRGHGPNTLNIPLDQLLERLQELDRARPILLCCATGSRSSAAAALLRQKGFEAVNGGSWQRLKEFP